MTIDTGTTSTTVITEVPAAATTPAPAAAPAAAAPATFDAATGLPVVPAADTPEAIAAAAAAAEAPAETDEQKAERIQAEAAAAGAPEVYTDFVAPENTMLDPEVMTEFGNVARELNLPQDKAQLLIDKMQPIIAARQIAQVETMRTTWGDETRALPEIGGANMEASLVHAARAMTAFGTPEFKALLNESALGNHPEVVSFMVRAGKAMAEEKIVTGGVPASTGIRSAADTLYPTPAVKK